MAVGQGHGLGCSLVQDQKAGAESAHRCPPHAAYPAGTGTVTASSWLRATPCSLKFIEPIHSVDPVHTCFACRHGASGAHCTTT